MWMAIIWTVSAIKEQCKYYQRPVHFGISPRILCRAKDIQFAFVSCPTDDGIYIRTFGWYADSAVYLVLYNYRNRLVSVETRGNGAGADTTWVPMVRSWTNRWQWDSYGCETCPEFQNGYGSIFRGSEANMYDLRVTDIDGNQVICSGLSKTSEGDIVRCLAADGTHQQFPYISVEVNAGCTGTSTSNLEYYKGDLPIGFPLQDPSDPSPAPSPTRTPASAAASASRTSAASSSRTSAASATRTPNAVGVSSSQTPAASSSRTPAGATSSRTPAVSPSSVGVSGTLITSVDISGTLITSVNSNSLGSISYDDQDSSSAGHIALWMGLLAVLLLQ